MNNETNSPLTPTSNRGVRMPGFLEVKSRVDWLTITTRHERIGLDWLTRYKEFRQLAPHWESAKSIKGFHGMGIDGFTWVVNPDTGWYMVILSGDAAGAMWGELAPKATNITRVDFAVTVTLLGPAKWVIKDHYNNIPKKHLEARNYTFIQSSDEGYTLYVGSRNSYNFGRIYDKGVQSGDYKAGNQFRYEVENKKPYSDVIARDIAYKVVKGEHEPSLINSYVYQWFTTRVVTPIFPPDYHYARPDLGVSVTTKEAKLSWLRTQVRPTVARLIEMGLGEETMKALDLLKYTQPGLWDDDTMERLTRKATDAD